MFNFWIYYFYWRKNYLVVIIVEFIIWYYIESTILLVCQKKFIVCKLNKKINEISAFCSLFKIIIWALFCCLNPVSPPHTLAGCSRRHHQAWLGCVVQTGAIKISSLGPFFVEISRSWILRSGQESVIQLMMCAESVPYILSPATSLVSSTAGNKPSRSLKFHNHGEGSY